MQRRAFQTLWSSVAKSGLNIRPAILHFHLMSNVLYSESQIQRASVEKRTDFSDLPTEKFGTLNQKREIQKMSEELPEEEDERYEFNLTNERGRKTRRPIKFYEDLIQEYVEEKKIVEALDVLETRMLKDDKVNPGCRVYNLLINGCARVGYTEKSFELYQKMKERGVKCTPATYTGLFNACANSPFSQDATKKLTTLRKSLAEKNVELTSINYHSMIKAYARLKHPHSAFLVADEMVSKGHGFTETTCCFLLQACISDTDAGLRHALLLWHNMRSRKVTPNIFMYNLFIRCIRDCGFGSEEDLQDVLKWITQGKRQDAKLIEAGEASAWGLKIDWKIKSRKDSKIPSDESEKVICEKEIEEIPENVTSVKPTGEILEEKVFRKVNAEIRENKPNLLAPIPHLGSILSVESVQTPSDRLLLLGGFKTVLEQMKADKVKPDIKTFTQLLDIVPSTEVAEKHILEEIKSHNIYIDIDFCNMLIKKRAFRGDHEKAREVLTLIQKNYLHPDIVTFGVLAASCTKVGEAQRLVFEMRDFGYRLNMPILGAMLKNATVRYKFDYVLWNMKLTYKIKIPASEEYMTTLKQLDVKMAEFIRRKKRRDPTVPEFINQPKFFERYRMWKEYYDRFKKEVTLQTQPHPYKQFQKTTEDQEIYENIAEDAENKGELAKTAEKGRRSVVRFENAKNDIGSDVRKWKQRGTFAGKGDEYGRDWSKVPESNSEPRGREIKLGSPQRRSRK